MPKAHVYGGENGTSKVVAVQCPACGYEHPFLVISANPGRPTWTWNGSLDKPTFHPSMLCMPDGPKRCHSWVRDGQIQFLPDSWHGRSDTVDLPEVED
jgi:hypothetical protein